MKRAQNEQQVSYTNLDKIIPYKGNAKLHPEKQINQIANSIKQFSFINPIIVDKKNVIIAGHGRFEAAKMLGMDKVPTISVDHLSDAEIRAYRLADNQLNLKTGYDDGLLKVELEELCVLNLDFDLEITGFETAEIDLIIQEEGDVSDEDDEIPEMEGVPVVTRPDDMWQLGNHRILCGDSLKKESYKLLLSGEKAQMIFTDPPYNVPISGHVCGNGKIKHQEFAMASGEMTSDQFTGFLKTNFTLLTNFSEDGSIHFICMDWRHMKELLSATEETYSELKNICIWNKNNGGMGSLYRSKHEMVFVLKNGKKNHINNVELGKHGRYRTNVWDYAGVCGKTNDLAMHPTVKPVAMIADAIMDCSHRKGVILDPFGGSGSTLIAAERTGRCACLLELEPKYVDVTIRRWEKLTGQDAIHISSGKTFTQTEGEAGDE